MDDYDFLLSLRDPKYDGFLGIRGDDLAVVGQATNLNGEQFNFTSDLNRFAMVLEEVPETDLNTLVVKPNATKFERGSFDLEFGKFYKDDQEISCSCMNDLLTE